MEGEYKEELAKSGKDGTQQRKGLDSTSNGIAVNTAVLYRAAVLHAPDYNLHVSSSSSSSKYIRTYFHEDVN